MTEKVIMENIRAVVKAARSVPTEFENQVALPYGLVDRLLNHADALEHENAELQARIGRLEQALETIRDWPHHLPIEAAQDIARCALNKNQIERKAKEES